MDDKINVNYVLDSQGARLERINKRLFILSIILIIVLFVSNGWWIYYESQMVDEVSIRQEVENDNSNIYMNGIGDVNYGEDSSNDN